MNDLTDPGPASQELVQRNLLNIVATMKRLVNAGYDYELRRSHADFVEP